MSQTSQLTVSWVTTETKQRGQQLRLNKDDSWDYKQGWQLRLNKDDNWDYKQGWQLRLNKDDSWD